MYRFPVADNDAFIHYTLESGKIHFIVRANVECDATFNFVPFGLRVGKPTKQLRVIAENLDKSDPENIHIQELHEETVFPGEIDLSDKSIQGIAQALRILETWADFMCLNFLNRKFSIEVQQPIQLVINISRPKMDYQSIQRSETLMETFFALPADKRKQVSRALWWYRKACIAQHQSVFESYVAYWNSLEVLCGVSPSKIRQGPEVDARIREYLRGKDVSATDIAHCYNEFVNQSIHKQMEQGLRELLDQDHAEQCINQCFKIKPDSLRLYQIRNDINHGNIRENSESDYLRAYLRGMLLWQIVMHILYRKLGLPLGPRPNFDVMAKDIETPFVDNLNPEE